MKRRDFLKKSSLAVGSIALNEYLSTAAQASEEKKSSCNASSNPPKLPQRKYGRTNVSLSIIGFGGIIVMGNEQPMANRIVAQSYEKGVTYFDVAPSYGKGEAEIKLGPALAPYRKQCFLACKTAKKDRKGAEFELAQSLERLKTDYLDLYQLHAITDVEKDVKAAFAKDGAMEVFLQAKKEGRVRYLGFSAHSEEAALAALDLYDFDSVLFPVNFACWHKGNFGQKVVAKIKEKKIALLALKVLARQKWPKKDPLRKNYSKCWYQPITDPQEASLAVAFTLSQPVTATIPPGDERLFNLAVGLALTFKPITEEQSNSTVTLADNLTPIFSTKKT